MGDKVTPAPAEQTTPATQKLLRARNKAVPGAFLDIAGLIWAFVDFLIEWRDEWRASLKEG